MDENAPFIANATPVQFFHWQALRHCFVIQLFSALYFFAIATHRSSLIDFLVLSKDSFFRLTPIFFNPFVENEVFVYIVNSVLSVVVLNFLLKYWSFRSIATFGLIVGWLSNFFTYLLFLLLSSIIKSLDMPVCGSYATVVGFAAALVYSGRSERQQIGSIHAHPSDIFLGTIFWVVVYLRWHPMGTVSALIGVAVLVWCSSMGIELLVFLGMITFAFAGW
jgi:hypothetical protein